MSRLSEFAMRYAAAWCSKSASSVAAHFSERGSLAINGAEPAIGRAAITKAVQGFMSALPDIVVKMDRLDVDVRALNIIGPSPGPIEGPTERAGRSGSADSNTGESGPMA
jgi:hypothetical protein